MRSVDKGKRGEREWANWIKETLDPTARRGFGQAAGGSCRPDVESSLPLHFEVKSQEALNIYKAMDQAIRDASPRHIPVVAHKKNRTPFHVTILARDLFSFCEIVNEARKKFLDNEHNA